MSIEPADHEDPVLGPDPTLSGLGPGPADGAGGFPNTASGTHLVLYQTEDGAVDLRWHLDPADIAHARAAFGGADAHAVLRLYHLDGHGEDRLMADADLGSDTDAEGGLAHYAGAAAQGLLQAEIGLASAEGGWLLIARSNGLPAAAPVGAAVLRGRAPAPAASPAAADSESADAQTAPAATGSGSAAEVPGTPLRLEPEFPLVEPELSALAATTVAPGEAYAAAPAEKPDSDPASAAAAAAGMHADKRAAIGTGPPAGPAAAAVGGIDASLGPAGYAARPPGLAAGQSPPQPPPGGVVPRLTQRPPRTPGQPDPPPEQGPWQQAPPMPGSGPIRPAAGEATLTAELVVHGSAPPNTLLDLGGHAYRVGPGGRFQLRIPIREREVIMRVLATLPRLPVAGRADGEAHGASAE